MNPLIGLILCGGESSRMGESKCFLRYHARPQWEHLAALLQPLCSGVIISGQEDQLAIISNSQPANMQAPLLAVDLPALAGHGPMSGVLTAARQRPGCAFLVVACDYPLLTSDVLASLIRARDKGADAICFSRQEDGLDEPLVAIYESTSLAYMESSFSGGAYSLRHLLKNVRTHRLPAPDGGVLQSIDTPEQYRQLLERMKRTS